MRNKDVITLESIMIDIEYLKNHRFVDDNLSESEQTLQIMIKKITKSEGLKMNIEKTYCVA